MCVCVCVCVSVVTQKKVRWQRVGLVTCVGTSPGPYSLIQESAEWNPCVAMTHRLYLCFQVLEVPLTFVEHLVHAALPKKSVIVAT